MLSTKGKNIVLMIALLFIFFTAAGFYWGSSIMNTPEHKQVAASDHPLNPRVTDKTVVIKDKEYLCRDLEKISEEAVSEELYGMDIKALHERFPAEQGWAVSFTDSRFLTLTVKVDEFCPVHRSYRHLGIYDGKVAVYEGPLGYKGRMLSVENIPVEVLNPNLRIKLEQTLDFENQGHFSVEELREDLEFSSTEKLNAALENLDEIIE